MFNCRRLPQQSARSVACRQGANGVASAVVDVEVLSRRLCNVLQKQDCIYIRSSTATVLPPDVQPRQSTILRTFEPVTEDEIQSILASAPQASCLLDPLPTWILKKLASRIFPVICKVWNLSLQTGRLPSCMKRSRLPTEDQET